MSYADANGVKLYVEETGSGYPIVFVHEFAADHREWETQVRYFSRNYRCITYAARGYPALGCSREMRPPTTTRTLRMTLLPSCNTLGCPKPISWGSARERMRP